MDQYKELIGAMVLGVIMVGLALIFVLWVAKEVLW